MDSGRRRLAEKVYAGERLTREDGAVLDASDDLAWLGRLAHVRRAARHGDRVTFVIGGPVPTPTPADLDRVLSERVETFVPEAGGSPAETLKAFAVARLLGDAIHVTCAPALHGGPLAQLALNFGADDLVAPDDADRDELLHLIWDAGLRPVERDSEHRIVREYDPPVPLAERRAEPQRVWA